jgi:hypothetical protein
MRLLITFFGMLCFFVAPRPAPAGTVVVASGALQRCLGITPGGARMQGPSAATQTYCQQLPASAIYNQAGQRFQAGDHAGGAAILDKAAKAGNAMAQLRLAMLYGQGDGVPRNIKTAIYWYTQAAQAGEPGSQAELATYYEEGDVIPEDWSMAMRLYQASAMQGWMKGQFGFGRCYEFGIGVPQNRQQAIAWFARSGAQGNAKGTYFAKWLSDRTNNIGFRNQMEHNLVLGYHLRFAGELMGGDPTGIIFNNSAQRILWLSGQRDRVVSQEAEVFHQMRKQEYEDCQRSGRGSCMPP